MLLQLAIETLKTSLEPLICGPPTCTHKYTSYLKHPYPKQLALTIHGRGRY